MDKAGALKIVLKFRSELEKEGITINRMILFGSYATGSQTEGSDIDVVVVSTDFKGLNHWQRLGLMTEALYKIFEPIEVRALTPQEWESSESITASYIKSGAVISV